MCSHSGKSSRHSKVVRVSHSERERILSEHRELRDFLELPADQTAQGEKSCSIKTLKRDIMRGCFLRNKKIIYCLEAQPELDMQELRIENADRALQESRPVPGESI